MMRSNSKFSYAIIFALLAMLGATPFIIKALWAQENPGSDSKQTEAQDKDDSPRVARTIKGEKDPFAVPDGTVDELIDYINAVQKVKPTADTEEAKAENALKIANAVSIACEKILAADPPDGEAHAVASVEFQALWHLASADDETALPRIDKLIEQLSQDERPEMVALSLENKLIKKLQFWDEQTEEQKAEFADDFNAFMTTGPLTEKKLQLAMTFGQLMDRMGESKVGISVYETLLSILPRIPETEDIIASMGGTIRRLNLPGNPIDIEGTTLQGEKFDWKAYRGKVVLIDFWATWCGPCIKEIPNLLESYEKYHDKGFEVVGISLDDESSDVKQFVTNAHIPWVTLLEKDPNLRGTETPMALKYGISGIPATILVDKEGKVVALSVFGKQLDEKLEEMLGSPK